MSSTRHKTSLHKIIQDLILNKDDNLTGRTGNNKDLDGWRKCNSQQLPHPCVVSLNLLSCKSLKWHWICHSVMNLSVHLAHLMMYNYFKGTVSTQVIICWLHSDVIHWLIVDVSDVRIKGVNCIILYQTIFSLNYMIWNETWGGKNIMNFRIMW